MTTFYGYHTYVDSTTAGVPFYVGKGNKTRVENDRRNKHHTNVAKKHGLNREIVLLTSVEALAFEIERDLITELHTFIDDLQYNGIGCNYTMGGEGHRPAQVTVERQRKKAKKRWSDPGERQKQSARLIGKNVGKKRTREWCEAKSRGMSGTNNPNWGKSQSPAAREKNRLGHLGKVPWNKGRTLLDIPSKKWKGMTVIDEKERIEFPSHKAAALFIAHRLGLSPNTVKCRLVARDKSYHEFTFSYGDGES